MSQARTQPTESAAKRNIFTTPQSRGWRETRAEFTLPRPLLEYSQRAGGHLKWCGPFYGGEFRAG